MKAIPRIFRVTWTHSLGTFAALGDEAFRRSAALSNSSHEADLQQMAESSCEKSGSNGDRHVSEKVSHQDPHSDSHVTQLFDTPRVLRSRLCFISRPAVEWALGDSCNLADNAEHPKMKAVMVAILASHKAFLGMRCGWDAPEGLSFM